MNKEMLDLLKRILEPEYAVLEDTSFDDYEAPAYRYRYKEISVEEAFEQMHMLFMDEHLNMDDARFTIMAGVDVEFDIMQDEVPMDYGIVVEREWDCLISCKLHMLGTLYMALKVLKIPDTPMFTNQEIFDAISIARQRLVHLLWYMK